MVIERINTLYHAFAIERLVLFLSINDDNASNLRVFNDWTLESCF